MVYKKIMFQTYIIFYNIFASKQVSICTVSLEFTLTKLASLSRKNCRWILMSPFSIAYTPPSFRKRLKFVCVIVQITIFLFFLFFPLDVVQTTYICIHIYLFFLSSFRFFSLVFSKRLCDVAKGCFLVIPWVFSWFDLYIVWTFGK
jgi:hypothetical protein